MLRNEIEKNCYDIKGQLKNALKCGNRDAALAILKFSLDRNFYYTRMEMDCFDGFRTVMLILKCTPENCCSEFKERTEAITEIIKQTEVDNLVLNGSMEIVKCLKMKRILEDRLKANNFAHEMAKRRIRS